MFEPCVGGFFALFERFHPGLEHVADSGKSPGSHLRFCEPRHFFGDLGGRGRHWVPINC